MVEFIACIRLVAFCTDGLDICNMSVDISFPFDN